MIKDPFYLLNLKVLDMQRKWIPYIAFAFFLILPAFLAKSAYGSLSHTPVYKIESIKQ